jgi:hypothetical protein
MSFAFVTFFTTKKMTIKIKTKQETNTMALFQIFLYFFINEARAQNSCESKLPMPFNAIDNRDHSYITKVL